MVSQTVIQAIEKRVCLRTTAVAPSDLSVLEGFFAYALERRAVELPSDLNSFPFFAEFFHYSRVRSEAPSLRLFFVKDLRLVESLLEPDEEKALQLIENDEVSELPIEVRISLESAAADTAIVRAEVRPQRGLLSLLISFYNGFFRIFKAIALKDIDSFEVASDADVEKLLAVCELEISKVGRGSPVVQAVIAALSAKKLCLSEEWPRSSLVLKGLKGFSLSSEEPLSYLIEAALNPARAVRIPRRGQRVL